MTFEKFLEASRRIVADHKAQYHGVYYMKGGVLGDVETVVGGVANEITGGKFLEPVTDIALAATGNPELIPLANAAETTTMDLAKGESVGKSLGQGGISGAEALGAQEAAGAIGVGSGNSLVNDALNVDISPGATGLPDVGGSINSALNSAGNAISSGASDALGATENALGITTPTDPTADSSGLSTIDAGLPTSSTTSAPSTTSSGGVANTAPVGSTVAAPSSGSLTPASSVDALASQQEGNLLSQGGIEGTSTANTTNLGSLATDPNADLQSPSASGASFLADSSTAASGSTSGGLSDYLPKKSDVGSTLLKAALPVGALAYEAIQGPAKLPAASSAIAPGGANTAPLTGIETTNATEATTGNLSPTQQANILQGVQQQQNALIQRLSSEGVQNPAQDSRYIAGMQQIQEWALAQQQAYIQQAVQNAVSAGGAASNNIATVANQQIANDTSYQNALAQAFGALGGFAAPKA